MKVVKVSLETAKFLAEDDPKTLVLDGRVTDNVNYMPEYHGDFTNVTEAEFTAEMEDTYDYIVVR
jgi:hypothetical protein